MVNAFSIAKFNVPPSLRTCNFDLWIKYQKILRLLGLDLPPEKIRGRPVGYYSDKLMEHFQAPRNNGPMANSDSIGLVGVPGQGPFFLLCLRLQADRVTEAKYQTNGCGATIAAGSVLTEMITGRAISECLAITSERLTEALGGVPPDKLHCPAMAVTALHDALRNHTVQSSGCE
jgi:nitrogen fixation NifU-like protein